MSRGAARRLGYMLAARRNGDNAPPTEMGVVAVDTDAGQGYLFNNANEADGFGQVFGESVGGRDSETLVQTYPVMDLRSSARLASPNAKVAPGPDDFEALLRWADQAAFFIVDFTEPVGADLAVVLRARELHTRFVKMRVVFGPTPKEGDSSGQETQPSTAEG